MNGATALADHRHVARQFEASACAKLGRQWHDLGRRMKVRAVELSEQRDRVAHLRRPLARVS